MAKVISNRADVSGVYGTIPVDNYSELSVELSSIGITKTADRTFWVEGELEYTIIVTNLDERDPQAAEPGLPVTGISLEDIIDPTIATLVANSVVINGTPAQPTDYSYDPVTGLLTILTLADLDPTESHRITFRVEQV